MVEANDDAFDPRKKENHDLPFVLIPNHGEDVLKFVLGARIGPLEGAHLDVQNVLMIFTSSWLTCVGPLRLGLSVVLDTHQPPHFEPSTTLRAKWPPLSASSH